MLANEESVNEQASGRALKSLRIAPRKYGENMTQHDAILRDVLMCGGIMTLRKFSVNLKK
jgi:hypothetical protein